MVERFEGDWWEESERINQLRSEGIISYDPSDYPTVDHEGERVRLDFSPVNHLNSNGKILNLIGVDLSGRDLRGAYLVRVDLSNANLSNAELLKSVFNGAVIDGTDFTNAVLVLPQVKSLCERATGKTADSLQCSGLNQSYVPASKEENKFNPGIG